MNVIVANERQNELVNLDIDIIKSMNGEFSVDEIVTTFKNFYFNKMILDVTAIKDYLNISNIQKLAMNLDVSKIIFFLPNIPEVSSSTYLFKLVSMGIYNFTNNIRGVKYLITHENTHDDVSYVEQVDELTTEVSKKVESGYKVIGIKNVTDHAGATTLIYMLKRELERIYGETIYVVEVNRHDFEYFNVKNAISTNKESLGAVINKLDDATVILVDLNDCTDESNCGDVLYLIEPSSIMLNKLMRTNRNIFSDLKGKKIVLNKSLLTSKDISEFEYESGSQVFYSIPPLDERRKNNEIVNLLSHLNLVGSKDDKKDGKIFGLFKF